MLTMMNAHSFAIGSIMASVAIPVLAGFAPGESAQQMVGGGLAILP
jgi:hypothetical protein